jgi:ribosomal protein S18 acetylase RimI-like enzyme
MLPKTEIQAFQSVADAQWSARIMAGSEPWITLGSGYEAGLKLLSNASRERYLAKVDGKPAGFLVISMQGAFVGYVQLLGVAPAFRRHGVGRALVEHAERRIFREAPNVFICVSDFNVDAQGFYAKMGYRRVGELKDFIVTGYAEILLRKTIGPIRAATGR